MLNLSKYKCAIFDCDGVILQSNAIKTEAFREVLNIEPTELVDQFISYHKKNGGVSRYVKFEYYYREIKKEKFTQDIVNTAIIRYADNIVAQLVDVDYIPGVIEIINYFNNHNIPCFVVSGGDEKELHNIFLQRNILDKFVKIFGSPVTKKQHILSMVKNGSINLPAIFFGDARSDMEAANYMNLDFSFIYGFSEWGGGLEFAIANDIAYYRDFTELLTTN